MLEVLRRPGWLGWLILLTLLGCTSTGVEAPAQDATATAGEAPAVEAAPAEEAAAEPSLELDALLPQDPNVRKGTFANGLTYYIRKNGRPEARAELRLVVNAGSIQEDDDQLGLAHFVEHMAFNGTENFEKQELVDYLQSVGMRFGADVNAYTSFDETVYMLQIPTDDSEIVTQAFQILEDWARAVSFEGEEIDKERGVVVEEWRTGLGAGSRIRDQQLPVLFKGSLYAERLPIGKKEILENCEHEVLRRFYRDWYRPDLMAVIAVGDFDPDIVAGLIRQHFAGLTNPKQQRPRETAEVPDHEETLFSIITDPEIPSSSINVAYKYDLEAEDHVADYRRSLVERLFESMLNARLAERAQEADPPFIGASSSRGGFVRDKGVYSLGAGVEEGRVLTALEALLTEAERARRHGFAAAELERQRADYLRYMERAYEEREKTNSRVYAAEYVRNFLEAEAMPGIAYELAIARRYMPTISVAEIDALAEEWIRDRSRVILVLEPEKEGVEPPDEEQLVAVFDTVSTLEIEPWTDEVSDQPLVVRAPPPAEITGRKHYAELDVHEWRLANGLRVFLKVTDFKNDQVAFSAFSPGGHSLVADEDYVPGASAASVVAQGGLGGFDLVGLEKALAGKVVEVSPYIGELSEGLTGGGSPQDLETLFQLIYLTFTAPREDSQAFTSYVTRVRALIRNQRVMPDVVFGEAINEELSQGHPRRRPFDEAFVDELDLERSLAIYRDRFADAGDFTFVFVGSFELEKIEPLVRTYLGGLPATGREETWRDVGVRRPDRAVERKVYKGLEPKSRYRIIFTGPFEQKVENRYLQASVESLLSDRLRERLREEMGGTYGARVSSSSAHDPIPEYSFSIGFTCDPERLPALRDALFAEIERLKTTEATAEELSRIREQQRRQRETAVETNGFWLGALRYVWEHGEDPMQILTYDERVASLSAERLQAGARQFFDLDRFVEVTLLPEVEPGDEKAAATSGGNGSGGDAS